MQGENLFEGKNVLNDDNVSPVFGSFLFVDDFFPATACVQFGFSDPDAKLLFAIVADEHQRLAFLIFCFIELYIIVTFRTSYSFHYFAKFIFGYLTENTHAWLNAFSFFRVSVWR